MPAIRAGAHTRHGLHHQIEVSAEIKRSEILKDMEKHPPGPEKQDRLNITTDPPTLKEIGISKDLSS